MIDMTLGSQSLMHLFSSFLQELCMLHHCAPASEYTGAFKAPAQETPVLHVLVLAASVIMAQHSQPGEMGLTWLMWSKYIPSGPSSSSHRPQTARSALSGPHPAPQQRPECAVCQLQNISFSIYPAMDCP